MKTLTMKSQIVGGNKMRRAILSLAILAALSNSVSAKSILIVRGLGGQMLQPMVDIGEALRKRGNHVVYDNAAGHFDVAIGHSAGGPVALSSGAALIITVDPIPNGGCPSHARCVNYYGMLSQVSGATNIRLPYDHVSMPSHIARRIIAEASK